MDHPGSDDHDNVVDIDARRREQASDLRRRAETDRADAAKERVRAGETRRHAAGVRKFIAERRSRLGTGAGAVPSGHGHHGPIGGSPQTPDQRHHDADERARVADQRDKLADERERTADQRDEAADERERLADLREHDLDDRERRVPPRAEPGSTPTSP
jgi:hypothetical protein